ncbi:MAG: DUF4416 family protein [Thermoguttaceae bacterium]|nr:DUF4416 family protein [Thermoguttaceae bacterium]
MGTIKEVKPVLLLVAAFGVSDEAIAMGRARAEEAFGTIAKESATYYFNDYTRYYENEMGVRLKKQFWVFENLANPGDLAQIKRTTNAWEEEIGAQLLTAGKVSTARPLNLDPGYIELSKLILATTKDCSHRIYLSDGIYAETTLMYVGQEWRSFSWSYADYQNKENQTFFSECRQYLKLRLRDRARNERKR